MGSDAQGKQNQMHGNTKQKHMARTRETDIIEGLIKELHQGGALPKGITPTALMRKSLREEAAEAAAPEPLGTSHSFDSRPAGNHYHGGAGPEHHKAAPLR